MAQIGNVEVDISGGGYGGDFSITANGDLLLAQDTFANPMATQERIARLVLTNAYIASAQGLPISAADDIFNPNYGSSIRALLGQPITPALLAGIKSRVLGALSTDPGIVNNPPPAIYVISGGSSQIPQSLVISALQSGVSVTNLQGAIFIFGLVYLVTGRAYPIPTTIIPSSGTPIVLPSAS